MYTKMKAEIFSSVAKKTLPLTMVFDHKIGGASELIPFIRKLDEVFENPEIILTW